MKLSSLLVAALILAAPACAHAGTNPDFERDAKPILAAQPGLVQYIHAHFVVRETGVARFPGTPGQPPRPPFIFSARPRGSSSAFYLRLLIQRGPAGQILKVADIRRMPPGTPAPGSAPQPEATAAAPAPESVPHIVGSSAPASAPAPSATPDIYSPTTAATPSGPVHD